MGFHVPGNVASPLKLGNVCVVDQVNGNNATAVRGGLPFLTITAALAAAVAGDVVWVLPGTYTEAIVIPASVSVHGLDRRRCIIDRTAIGVATDIVTLNANSRISEMTITGSTAAAVQLRGVVVGNVSSAVVRNCTVTLTHTGAGTCVGVQFTAGGTPSANFATLQNTEVSVSGSGAQIRRGLLVSVGATSPIVDSCEVLVTRTGGAVGTYYAAEVNGAGSVFTLIDGIYTGPTGAGGADVAQTVGTLALNNASLGTLNANGLGFSALSGTWTEWSGCTGIPTVASTTFFRAGTTPGTLAAERAHEIRKPAIAIGLVVRAGTAPGGGQSNVYGLRRNGALIVGFTVTLSGGGGTSGSIETLSQGYGVGDTYSPQVVSSLTSAQSDVQIGILWYTG
jgi:hypothetical protein